MHMQTYKYTKANINSKKDGLNCTERMMLYQAISDLRSLDPKQVISAEFALPLRVCGSIHCATIIHICVRISFFLVSQNYDIISCMS